MFDCGASKPFLKNSRRIVKDLYKTNPQSMISTKSPDNLSLNQHYFELAPTLQIEKQENLSDTNDET